MNNNIVFIGPFCSGKTSVSEELSKITNIPLYPVDRWKWYFLYKNGFTFIRAREILHDEGFISLGDFYRQCFSISELTNFVEQFPSSIIEISPYHVYYKAKEDISKMNSLLEVCKHVFLLVPYQDCDRTISVLNERLHKRFSETKQDFPQEVEGYKLLNNWFIQHEITQNRNIKTIYTQDFTVEEIAKKVIKDYLYKT